LKNFLESGVSGGLAGKKGGILREKGLQGNGIWQKNQAVSQHDYRKAGQLTLMSQSRLLTRLNSPGHL
jgi:membrane protein involved in colicin uptake